MSRPIIVNADLDNEEGTIVATLQHWKSVAGRFVVVLGDPIPDHEGVMIQGSTWMRINGLPVCRAADATSCGHVAVPSQFFWRIA